MAGIKKPRFGRGFYTSSELSGLVYCATTLVALGPLGPFSTSKVTC